MSWLLWCWITLLRVPWTIRRFKSINPNGKWTWKLLSSVWVFVTPWTIYTPWNSLGLNTGVGSHSLLQEIFPNQGSNLLAHCRQILYQAEPQGKPKNTGVGSISVHQWIFPTQELNKGLLHFREILYQLSYQGSLLHRITVWIKLANVLNFFNTAQHIVSFKKLFLKLIEESMYLKSCELEREKIRDIPLTESLLWSGQCGDNFTHIWTWEIKFLPTFTCC